MCPKPATVKTNCKGSMNMQDCAASVHWHFWLNLSKRQEIFTHKVKIHLEDSLICPFTKLRNWWGGYSRQLLSNFVVFHPHILTSLATPLPTSPSMPPFPPPALLKQFQVYIGHGSFHPSTYRNHHKDSLASSCNNSMASSIPSPLGGLSYSSLGVQYPSMILERMLWCAAMSKGVWSSRQLPCRGAGAQAACTSEALQKWQVTSCRAVTERTVSNNTTAKRH